MGKAQRLGHAFTAVELAQTPMLEQAGLDEPLVDDVQLVLVARLPVGNGLCVAMHGVCFLPGVVQKAVLSGIGRIQRYRKENAFQIGIILI